MIFDRTIFHVNESKKIFHNKISKGEEPTPQEQEILDRGFFGIGALNRIEQKQLEVQNDLIELGYWHKEPRNKIWDFGEWFTKEDLERIVNTNSELKKSFFVSREAPIDAVASFYYEEINRIEKMLFDLETNANSAINNYRYCGTINCGGNI